MLEDEGVEEGLEGLRQEPKPLYGPLVLLEVQGTGRDREGAGARAGVARPAFR